MSWRTEDLRCWKDWPETPTRPFLCATNCLAACTEHVRKDVHSWGSSDSCLRPSLRECTPELTRRISRPFADFIKAAFVVSTWVVDRHQYLSAACSHSRQFCSRWLGDVQGCQAHRAMASLRQDPVCDSMGKLLGLRLASTICHQCEASHVSFTGQWCVVGEGSTRLTCSTKDAMPSETTRLSMTESFPLAQAAALGAMILPTVASQRDAPVPQPPGSDIPHCHRGGNLEQPTARCSQSPPGTESCF